MHCRACAVVWKIVIDPITVCIWKMTIFQILVNKICVNLAEFRLTSQFTWRSLENLNQNEEFRRISCCKVIRYFLKKISKFSVRMSWNWYHEIRFVYCRLCTKQEEKLIAAFFCKLEKTEFLRLFSIPVAAVETQNSPWYYHTTWTPTVAFPLCQLWRYGL